MDQKEKKDERKWYQKKRWIIGLTALAIFIFVAASAPTAPAPSVESAAQTTPVRSAINTKANAPVEPIAQPTYQPDALSNDSYYEASSGDSVHSPAYSENGGVPAGASAECGDGTYSFSEHRSGTCSHHGGVEEWL